MGLNTTEALKFIGLNKEMVEKIPQGWRVNATQMGGESSTHI
jgi:hypothetical protein